MFKWTLALLLSAGSMLAPAAAGILYEARVVAKRGDPGLSDIETDSVSLNDYGMLAFVGKTPTGTGVFLWDEAKGLRNIAPGAFKFGPVLQINNGNHVAVDNVSSVLSLVRVWDERGAATAKPIAGGGGAGDPFGTILPFPSINNFEEVVFLATMGANWVLATPRSGGFNTTVIPRGMVRPVIADDAHILVRLGPDDKSAVFLYPFNLGAPAAIANSGMGFTDLGIWPRISDDGRVVVFYGRKDGEPGVFGTLANSPSRVVRLAGLGDNDTFDPGEQVWIVPGKGGPVLTTPRGNDSLRILQFFGTDGISVNSIGSSNGVQFYWFSFTAKTQLYQRASNAIWIGTLRVENGVLQLNTPPFPIVVADGIEGLASLSSVVPDVAFALHDGLNTNRQIAFAATRNDGSKSVVRANVFFEPIRQTSFPGGTNAYGWAELSDFIKSLEANPGHPDYGKLKELRALRDQNLLNISAKGCALSSLSMAVNILYGLPIWTPERLAQYLEQHGAISPITRVSGASSVTGVLKFDGLDLRRNPDKEHAKETTYPGLLRLKPTRPLTQKQQVWDYLADSTRTKVAVLTINGHRILGIGLPSPIGSQVMVIDPWMRRDQTVQDQVFALTEFGAFKNRLRGFVNALPVELSVPERRLEGLAGAAQGNLSGYIRISGGAEFNVTFPSGEKVGFAGADQEPNETPFAAYYVDPPILEAEGIWTDGEIATILNQSPRVVEFDGVKPGDFQVAISTNHANATFTITGHFDSGVTPVDTESQRTLADGQPLTITINAKVGESSDLRPTLMIAHSDDPSALLLTLIGTPGKRYQVQVSTDLRTWSDWGSSVVGAPTLVFNVRADPTQPNFYRAIELP